MWHNHCLHSFAQHFAPTPPWFNTLRTRIEILYPAADLHAVPKAANITATVAFDTFASGTGTNKTGRTEIREGITVSTRNTRCPDNVWIFCVKWLIVSSSSTFDFVSV